MLFSEFSSFYVVPTRVYVCVYFFLKHHPCTRECVGTECLIIAIFVILFTIIDDNSYAKLNNHLLFIGSRRDCTHLLHRSILFLYSYHFWTHIQRIFQQLAVRQIVEMCRCSSPSTFLFLLDESSFSVSYFKRIDSSVQKLI